MPARIVTWLTALVLAGASAAFAQLPAAEAVKLRMQIEKAGKAAAEAARPSDAEQATALVKQLDSPDEQVRADAVGKLRLLSRRVDRIGGARTQRGDVFEPKVPGLIPQLIKAAQDPGEYVRLAAVYALADTLDQQVIPTLRELVDDPKAKVRTASACLLTELHDASGLEILKKDVRRYQAETNEVERYLDGEHVLYALERITGKSFGPIPMNPLLYSNSEKGKAAENRYQELFDNWVDWWDWTPTAK